MINFFKLMRSTDVLSLYERFSPLGKETIPVASALGRIAAEDIVSGESLPPFSRSTVDGFAVRARSTFGCSESEPALLEIAAEIPMGKPGHTTRINAGQSARIWTGGELPAKAEAVVMVEYTKLFDENTIAIYRPVAPGENVIATGEDYQRGETVIQSGTRLRPQDLGVLAGLGITSVSVYRRPRVGIISTGDELVPPDVLPPPGKIRDINSTTLRALVEETGSVAKFYGICDDNFDNLYNASRQAAQENDIILLSGGSSVGRRDYTLRVFEAFDNAELLVHGISIRPGKPTILAKYNNIALFGLPGHVVSAMVVFHLFVRPMIHRFAGLPIHHGLRVIPAITSEQIPSAIGREEYVRVKLTPQEGDAPCLASPIYGKSGLISPLVQANGLLPIHRDSEGLDKGTRTKVLLFPTATVNF